MFIYKFINKILRISLYKTFRFNFHYLKIKQAFKFPILISKRVKVKNFGRGKIIFESKIKPGMLRIGFLQTGTQDSTYSRTIWELKGIIKIKKNAAFGSGSKISIDEGGELILGNDFICTGGSTFICNKHIEFGDHVLVSWDVLFYLWIQIFIL